MTFQESFNNAVAAYNQDDVEAASTLCESLLARMSDNPDVLHLLGLIRRKQGRVHQAEQCYRKSLRANPRQPVVYSNLGNLLQSQKRFAEADESYESAIGLKQDLRDAWYNRGVTALEQADPERALRYLEQARNLQIEPAVDLALIRTYRDLGRFDEAHALLSEVGAKLPGEARVAILKASVFRASQNLDEVEATLVDALDQVSDPSRIHYELGTFYLDQVRTDSGLLAEEHFKMAVEGRPEMIEAHRSLNEVYWQQDDNKFASSYKRAIDRLPDYPPLYHNLASAYISAGRYEDAASVLKEGVKRIGRIPPFVHALGVEQFRQGEYSKAGSLYEEALKGDPDNIRYLVDLANLKLRLEEYDRAAQSIDTARRVAPNNQEVWAYQGLLWRLVSDEKESWLNNYDLLLKEYELPAPKGFRNIEEFMAALAELLNSMHTSKRQPLDQSVRNGTQTMGMLLNESEPLIQHFREAVTHCVNDYLARLPADENHPFLARRGQEFRFTGSWSVRLGSHGYHSNHVHPYGWLSCCNYISLPDLGESDASDRRGWIKFGETSLELPDRERVARALKPEVGKCVFFPSMFWHGTYAFESDHPRMTVPCDIDPR